MAVGDVDLAVSGGVGDTFSFSNQLTALGGGAIIKKPLMITFGDSGRKISFYLVREE